MLDCVDAPTDPTLPRRIAHLDMDAFFASVELLRYPQLKGLPVVIGGGRRREDDLLQRLRESYPDREWATDSLDHIPVDFFPRLAGYTGRGVATTATYAARQFGVGSAMGLMKAAKLCPQAILLPVDFEEVRRISRLFKSTIREIAPVVEDRGVDEVYIDFTHVPGGQREGGRVLARLIQKSIFQATGLTCSIGVAPNKLIAKMASEFKKPNGISIVQTDDLQTLIWPLPCRKINGVGPKADEKLQGHGIHTIGELAQRERGWLIDTFGKSYGAWLFDVSWGRDERARRDRSGRGQQRPDVERRRPRVLSGAGDQHPRRILVRRQNGNRFSALNHQRFIVVQVQQSPTDIVKRRPIARCLSQTAVYNQIFRTFSHFGIQVVVQHAICRFLNPTFTIQFAARGRLQYP